MPTIDPIHPDRPWSAKAAAGDALERAPHNAPIVCLWLDENGVVRWSKANTTPAAYALFSAWCAAAVQKWIFD